VAVLLLLGLLRPAAPSAGSVPQQRFGATVSRVRVDVIVTDDDGAFVTDLGADDFVVTEDGERQRILDVQLVDIPAGRVYTRPAGGPSAAQAPAGAAAPAAAEVTGDVPANTAASELGAVIFLIDAPSLDQQAKARFGDAWEKILAQTDVPQVPRAVYMFTNYGRIEELAPLTTDVEEIRGAAEAVRDAPFYGTSMRRRLNELANDLTTSTATRTEDLARQLAAAKARGFEVEERNRSLATYELLTNLADALWTRSGRTAVVWVSTGVKLMQGGPYSAMIAFDPRFASVPVGEPAAVDEGLASTGFDVFSPDAGIREAQQRLERAANAANVSFYTIDPTLLSSTRQVGGDVEVGSAAAAQMLANRQVEASLDAMRDSMRNAAEETGGRSYIQDTDIALALEDIEADTGRFYLISYAPPEVRGDGAYHEIGVDVLRDGVNVRARGGYVDYPTEERARRGVEVALTLPGLANELPVEAEAFRSRPPSGGPNLLTAVAIDGADVGVAVGSQGEREVSLDVHMVILDGEGVVDQGHEQLAGRTAPDGSFRPGSGGGLKPTLVGFLAYEREWELPPGAYTVNVAVLDNISGKVGATSLDVDVAGPDEGWGISDPIIATVDDAGRVQPVVLGHLLEGQSASVFVEVYGGVRPVLGGRVHLDPADGGDPAQGARLFSMAMRPSGPGLHRGSLLLPPGMPPGRYVVELQITDEAMRRDETVPINLRVVSPAGR